MSKSRDEASSLEPREINVGKPLTPAETKSAAAAFQYLAASCEFTPADLREAVDGLDLLGMSLTDPSAFAAIAKEVGANVRGMKGDLAVREVVRAIMSGKKGVAK